MKWLTTENPVTAMPSVKPIRLVLVLLSAALVAGCVPERPTEVEAPPMVVIMCEAVAPFTTDDIDVMTTAVVERMNDKGALN